MTIQRIKLGGLDGQLDLMVDYYLVVEGAGQRVAMRPVFDHLRELGIPPEANHGREPAAGPDNALVDEQDALIEQGNQPGSRSPGCAAPANAGRAASVARRRPDSNTSRGRWPSSSDDTSGRWARAL